MTTPTTADRLAEPEEIDTEKERTMFEAVAKDDGIFGLERHEKGWYRNHVAQYAWQYWKQRASLAQQQATQEAPWPVTKEWVAAFPESSARIINEVARRLDAMDEAAAPPSQGEPAPNEAPPQPQALPECFARLLEHAYGMSFGMDWNKGTAASFHRTKLLKAVDDCRAYQPSPCIAKELSEAELTPAILDEALSLLNRWDKDDDFSILDFIRYFSAFLARIPGARPLVDEGAGLLACAGCGTPAGDPCGVCCPIASTQVKP